MKRLLNYSASSYKNLSENSAHQFAMAHALNIYSAKTIYSFIPKNACSTMRLSLAIQNGCIESVADHNWIHKNNRTFTADLAGLIAAEYTFVILRCPYSRLASAYLDKVVGGEHAGKKFAAMIGARSGVGRVTFDTFVRAMQNPAVKHGNGHWRPQSDFLVYKQYDDYFCIEEFKSAILKITERTSMPIRDARELTGHGLDKLVLLDQCDYSKWRTSEIQAMKLEGKCPAPHKLYNYELISIVREVFADDLALYVEKFGSKNIMFG